MKLRIFLSICLCTILFAVAVGAQGTTITEKDYNAVIDAANKKMDKIVHRKVTETKAYKSNKLISTETLTIDTFPNEDSRWLEVTNKDGKTEETLNLIYLGKFEYRKECGSAWSKTCLRDCGKGETEQPAMTLHSSGELPKMTQYIVYDSPQDGVPAKLYVFYRVYNLGQYLNFYQLNTWISKDGLIIRSTQKQSDVYPDNMTEYQTVNYLYDSKEIKPIEAPIK